MATAGKLIDELFNLREQKRTHEEAIKQLQESMDSVERSLLAQMEAEGLSKATGRKATVTATELIRPNVEDWDSFYAYIHRNKFYHLLERRPSASGCKELFETKGKIPGVVPSKQKRINMRAL